jgi:hypothetical protein
MTQSRLRRNYRGFMIIEDMQVDGAPVVAWLGDLEPRLHMTGEEKMTGAKLAGLVLGPDGGAVGEHDIARW